MSPTHKDLQPTAAAQRVSVIDSLRGLAIFGLLVVNVLYFFGSWYTPVIREAAPSGGACPRGFCSTSSSGSQGSISTPWGPPFSPGQMCFL